MSFAEPLFDVLSRDGAHAALRDDAPPPHGDADAVLRLVREAVAATDHAALDLWDRAGALHDPASLDEVLRALVPRFGVPLLSGVRRRRLRAGARLALRRTARTGTLRLACAVLGEVGTAEDAADLEAVARHKAFTLHGATALGNLRDRAGLLALLRLLTGTEGAARVLVIDRLLAFVREPAVRLALVRDAFSGLDEASGREIAPAVVETLGLAHWLGDDRVVPEMREAVRRILALAGHAPDAP